LGNSDLGSWLKATRKGAGLTQRQVAEKLGAPISSVSRWERGQNCPQPVYCYQLAFLFGAPARHILELAGHDPEQRVALVAPPVVDGLNQPCGTCSFFLPCQADEALKLPVFCEAPDVDDCLLAAGEGQLHLLKIRYDYFQVDFPVGDALLQPGDAPAVSPGVG